MVDQFMVMLTWRSNKHLVTWLTLTCKDEGGSQINADRWARASLEILMLLKLSFKSCHSVTLTIVVFFMIYYPEFWIRYWSIGGESGRYLTQAHNSGKKPIIYTENLRHSLRLLNLYWLTLILWWNAAYPAAETALFVVCWGHYEATIFNSKWTTSS